MKLSNDMKRASLDLDWISRPKSMLPFSAHWHFHLPGRKWGATSGARWFIASPMAFFTSSSVIGY